MTTELIEPKPKQSPQPTRARPRVGFLGLGWIGRNRMQALADSGLVEVVAFCDASMDAAIAAAQSLPKVELVDSLKDLLEVEMDGLVIATPSAMHAEQAATALERGVAVFCQKPLGRNAAETSKVIDTARQANRLLGVDLSYRFISCLQNVYELCRSGQLGEVYAADLTFHNAYGPDKPWFYDARFSGGGCVIDLGIHLVDLALWNLGFPKVASTTSNLYSQGRQFHIQGGSAREVEDYAVATLTLSTGATIQISCSWKLPVGCDARISGFFYGTKGGAAFHNLDGSFYDFAAERFRGTNTEKLASPREQWGGRAAVHWARQLANGGAFDPDIERLKQVAGVLDAIYEAA
jgi:predicted dehydrogenase